MSGNGKTVFFWLNFQQVLGKTGGWVSHSREGGNPVHRLRISKGMRSGFPLSRE